MKTRKILMLLFGFATYFVLHFVLISYDNNKAHPTFNSEFVKYIEAIYIKQDPLKTGLDLELTFVINKLTGPGVTDPGYLPSTTGESDITLSPAEWISHGGYSADEPEVPAAVRHFYDPLALDGVHYLTDQGTWWEGYYTNPHIDAIEWALGDTPKGSDNKWSAKKGKEYMAKALQESDPQKKRELLAKAWRCFGEVLHNLADMACPPHVRNDSHAAPLGLSWGWALGSPDPYEQLFNPAWIAKYKNSSPDPSLSKEFQNAASMRTIHEKMAAFTNSNFFTEQTISGIGHITGKGDVEIKPINHPLNKGRSYPSPKLENLEYVDKEYTFYKTFPSGRRIKMAKDKGFLGDLFVNRTRPYIDEECVESQASELIPNFFAAAAKDFELFMPPLRVEIIVDNIGYSVKGTAKTYPNKEYPDTIYYNGTVSIFIDKKEYTTQSTDGEFELTLSQDELKNSKKIYAVVNLYGIKYYSIPSNFNELKSIFSFWFSSY
jgi:hypothetical protein